jgi:NAD(P)-dependent dehydrogenase (short-subunit alcohol dehydrogenase family)
MAFRVLIIGGTGQVGAAVVRALAAEPSCAEVVMVNRRAISPTADPRVRQVILDTAAAQFPAEVTKLAQSMVAQGEPVYGASCVGVGKGSMKWSEEELKALEIGVAGGFARGCQASALGSGKQLEKQDSLCAGHGVERRGGSRDRLPTPRDFSSGNYCRQCSHAAVRSLVGASDSGTFWHD